MTAISKRREPVEIHPLLAKPIPHAYALVADPERPGRFFAVHLQGIVAERLTVLEPSARSEPATYGLQRIHPAMERRHTEKKWTL